MPGDLPAAYAALQPRCGAGVVSFSRLGLESRDMGAWRVNLLLAAVVTGVALAASEGAVRLIAPVYSSIYQPDDTLLHRYVPGSRKLYRHRRANGGAVIDVRINRLGFHGRELSPPAGRTRVAVYGDSFVAGEFSREGDTFTQQLGRALEREASVGVQAVNGGVNAYGPDQAFLKLRGELDLLQPDLVVLAVFAENDFGDLLRNKLFTLDATGALIPRPHRLDQALRAELAAKAHPTGLERLHLVRLVEKVWSDRWSTTQRGDATLYQPARYIARSLALSVQEYEEQQQGDDVVSNLFLDHYDADLAVAPDTPSARYKVRLMEGVLGETGRTLAARRIPLFLVVIPSPIDVCPGYEYRVDSRAYPRYRPERLSATVAEIAARQRIPSLNLFGPFHDQGACGLYFRAGNNHWNDRGQALAARLVTDAIVRAGLLSSTVAPGTAPRD